MLQPYLYKRHPVQRAQSFVNYLFLEVIFRASRLRNKVFSPAMVKPLNYRKLIEGVDSKYMLTPLKKIYSKCKNLPRKDIKILRRAVLANNCIEELCRAKYTPVLYSDLEAIDRELSDTIKSFCTNLYKHVMPSATFIKIFGSIAQYYKTLAGNGHACHFCGMDSIISKYEKNRSALDHYLAKSLYPFTTVNFHNLVPACEKCNTTYKRDKNILFLKPPKKYKTVLGARVKAFYPFCNDTPNIDVAVKFNRPYKDDFSPDDFDMTIQSAATQQETENWRRIYNIDSRYKAYCCSDTMKSYIEHQFIAFVNKGLLPHEYINSLKTNPMNEQNFLKIPFLENVKTIFDPLEEKKD